MHKRRLIPFKITGIDSLGQGVSKLEEKVTFIPKTAIGDEGQAQVMAERKGVTFARAVALNLASPERITPACSHFAECPSCHFQHLPYERELALKTESFERLFRKFSMPQLEVIAAPERYGYRNRIQLHYSLRSKLIGMRDPQTFDITPIPDCLIGTPEIVSILRTLYQNDSWLNEAPKDRTEGHVELYWISGELRKSWNRPYAEGGFTQVYETMNRRLKELLRDHFAQTPPSEGLLDLFAGNGNLSATLGYQRRLCIDVYRTSRGEDFFDQDLYAPGALKAVLQKVSERDLQVSHLILDPPRSGLRDFRNWIETLKPRFVAYVSCDPHTLVRDLQGLDGYEVTRSFLLDFFPATFHFESMIFLERKG
jgi:23S rRNA (uracil1939-C5)-methyltransferase